MVGELRKASLHLGARSPASISGSPEGPDPFFRRRIGNLIESVLGLDRGEAHVAARLREDFGVDFLDLLELAWAMEAELDIQIPDLALEQLTTVDDLMRVASRALAPAPVNATRRRDPGAHPLRQRKRRAASAP